MKTDSIGFSQCRLSFSKAKFGSTIRHALKQDGSSHTKCSAISGSVLDEVMHGRKFISSADELWKYLNAEKFQNAIKMHQIKRDKYVRLRTGLRYSVLLEWHLEGHTPLMRLPYGKEGSNAMQS